MNDILIKKTQEAFDVFLAGNIKYKDIADNINSFLYSDFFKQHLDKVHLGYHEKPLFLMIENIFNAQKVFFNDVSVKTDLFKEINDFYLKNRLYKKIFLDMLEGYLETNLTEDKAYRSSTAYSICVGLQQEVISLLKENLINEETYEKELDLLIVDINKVFKKVFLKAKTVEELVLPLLVINIATQLKSLGVSNDKRNELIIRNTKDIKKKIVEVKSCNIFHLIFRQDIDTIYYKEFYKIFLNKKFTPQKDVFKFKNETKIIDGKEEEIRILNLDYVEYAYQMGYSDLICEPIAWMHTFHNVKAGLINDYVEIRSHTVPLSKISLYYIANQAKRNNLEIKKFEKIIIEEYQYLLYDTYSPNRFKDKMMSTFIKRNVSFELNNKLKEMILLKKFKNRTAQKEKMLRKKI